MICPPRSKVILTVQAVFLPHSACPCLSDEDSTSSPFSFRTAMTSLCSACHEVICPSRVPPEVNRNMNVRTETEDLTAVLVLELHDSNFRVTCSGPATVAYYRLASDPTLLNSLSSRTRKSFVVI